MTASIFETLPVRPVRSGLLGCWKPAGMTSRDFVNHLQRRLQLEWGRPRLKIGHLGTLDPLAEGVVVIVVGTATRLTPWLIQTLKRYTGTFELGAWSESGDTEETVERSGELPRPDLQTLIAAAQRIHGVIEQTPPGHSAIRINGLRAYDRIRRGETFDIPSREVWIESLSIVDYCYPRLTMDVTCGSGTYLRSLGDDLAISLGTRAVMTGLTRQSVGDWNQQNSVPAELALTLRTGELGELLAREGNLDSLWPQGFIHERIVPTGEQMHHMPRIVCTPEQAIDVMHGRGINVTPTPPPAPLADGFEGTSQTISDEPRPKPGALPDDVVAINEAGDVIAILRPKRGGWWPHRVIVPM